jgi:hypothetical protein
MEKLTEELKLQMEGVISEFNKMDSFEKYKGILFKLGNTDAFICREVMINERKEENFIFNLNRTDENGGLYGGTFLTEDEHNLVGVLVSIEKVKPFINPNLKLHPVHFPDKEVWMKPMNRWSNKEMKTKKDRVRLSRHLCLCLGYSSVK